MRSPVARSSCWARARHQLARVLSRPSGSCKQVAARNGPQAAFQQRRAVGAAILAAAPGKDRHGFIAGHSALPSDRRAAAPMWGAFTVGATPTWLGIARLCRVRAALGGHPCDKAPADPPTGGSSFARPSNSTLQPTSEAVTGVR